MDPMLTSLSNDLTALNQRLDVLAPQFSAFRLRISNFLKEQTSLLDDAAAQDARAQLS